MLVRAVAIVALVFAGSVTGANAAGNPAADIDQCANGPASAPATCTGAAWVNGELGHSKAHYAEGESVPYRLVFTNLAAGSHTVTIQWDTTKQAKHALDYLTTYNRTETTADPVADTPLNGTAPTQFAIPQDAVMQGRPDWQAGAVQVAGSFTFWGGTITAVSPYTYSGDWAADSSNQVTITFTSTGADGVLAWGGHIARRLDWGLNNAAADISGSPFHMRLLDLDGKGGNQDRALSRDAVVFPALITVVKDAQPDTATPFPFAVTPAGGVATNFNLVDDGNAATRTWTSPPITTFGSYTVTEAAVAGWTLTSLACTDPTGAPVHDLATRTATIDVAEGDLVTCTFTNVKGAVGAITVTKTANPTSVVAPGAPVAFTVLIENPSAVDVTITSITDSVYGDLAGVGTCTVPQTIAAGNSYSCTFTKTVTGVAGSSHTDIVTASGTDANRNPVSDNDDATVTVTGGGGPTPDPAIEVVKTAAPAALPEPGGTATFTVTATNPVTGQEPVLLVSLVDSVYGNLDGLGTCDLNPAPVLDPGDSYTCSFSATVSGNAGSIHVDTVTATAADTAGKHATDTDPATVAITDVMPTLTIVKTASADVVHVGDAVTYTYEVTTAGPDQVLDVIVTDDRCSPVTFTGGDTDGDAAVDVGETWTYTCTTTLTGDTLNTATATAHDDEGNQVTDTDTAAVDVIDARIAITKVPSATNVTVGDTVTYTYTVTNPGNDPLGDVKVTDDKCGPVTFVGGDVDSDALLDPDEAWVFTCSAVIGTPSLVTNVATVTAVDSAGEPVSADATATVAGTEVLGEQIVAPAAALPTTGGDPHRSLAVAMAMIVLGAGLVAASRRSALRES